MNRTYLRINWENWPSENTALDAENLNNMDQAIYKMDGDVVTLDATKLNITDAARLIADISFDDQTGVITCTRKDGSTFTIDTVLEKVVTNFRYDATTQELVLTLQDGTTQRISLSDFITETEFVDSSTIAFTVSNHVVTAEVKNGSITGEKLQPNYLADVTQQAGIATAAANSATASKNAAALSEANAATSETNAAASAMAAATSATNAASSESNAATSESNAAASETAAALSETNAASSATNAAASESAAAESEANAASSETNAAASSSNADAKALVSEGWAKGTQNGIPVGSGSPYYHNNAEYFKDQAQASAGSPSLASLADTDISAGTLADGQVLKYDAANHKWKNETPVTPTSALSALTDVDINTPNANQVLTYNPTSQKWENGKTLPFNLGTESGSYGYYNAQNQFVPFKSQADIDAAVAAAMVGDAAAGDVLTGKTFTNQSTSGVSGSMPNNGAVSATLDAGTTNYIIPAGYHNGSGAVNVVTQSKSASPSTAAQTISADTGKVLSSVAISAISPQRASGIAATNAGTDTTGPYIYFPYGWHPQVNATYGAYIRPTAAHAQAMHAHTGTYTASARSASIDLGEKHNYRYVNTTGVPSSMPVYRTTVTPTYGSANRFSCNNTDKMAVVICTGNGSDFGNASYVSVTSGNATVSRMEISYQYEVVIVFNLNNTTSVAFSIISVGSVAISVQRSKVILFN